MSNFSRKIRLIVAVICVLQLHMSSAVNLTEDAKGGVSIGEDLATNPPADTIPEKDADAIPEKDADSIPEKDADIIPEKDADTIPEKDADTIPEKAADTISEKTPEFISHAATMIIVEPGRTTESATAGVLETTESEDEGIKKSSTSGITSTTSSMSAETLKEKAPENTFAVWNSDGKICLLAKFQAEFKISFPSKGGDQGLSSSWLPETVKSRGKCGDENKAPFLLLSWDEYALHISFSKLSEDDDEVNEWALTNMEFRYDMSTPLFDGTTNTGKKTARSKNDLKAFKTEFGKSYYCPTGKVNLFISNKTVVTVEMKDIQLQPFGVENGNFSKAQRCNQVVIGGPEEPPIQDETVPLAVGLTLTILTLIVVLGFSVHRAYTMRKVDYNSME